MGGSIAEHRQTLFGELRSLGVEILKCLNGTLEVFFIPFPEFLDVQTIHRSNGGKVAGKP
jgi:hypothetical protein